MLRSNLIFVLIFALICFTIAISSCTVTEKKQKETIKNTPSGKYVIGVYAGRIFAWDGIPKAKFNAKQSANSRANNTIKLMHITNYHGTNLFCRLRNDNFVFYERGLAIKCFSLDRDYHKNILKCGLETYFVTDEEKEALSLILKDCVCVTCNDGRKSSETEPYPVRYPLNQPWMKRP